MDWARAEIPGVGKGLKRYWIPYLALDLLEHCLHEALPTFVFSEGTATGHTLRR